MAVDTSASVTYRVTHRSEYTYEQAVVAGYNLAHLVPRSLEGQVCRHSRVLVEPSVGEMSERIDYFGNVATWFSVFEPHHHLAVTATSEVVRDPTGRVGDPAGDVAWEEAVAWLGDDPDADGLLAREFVLDSPLVPTLDVLDAYARESFRPGRGLREAALDLTSRLFADLAYVPGATTTTTRLEEVLRERRGVCQDFAHVGIGCLRVLGIPARYVSGYMETEPPPGQEKLVGADASHAWLSMFAPGFGWIDLDPTNDTVPDERYVTTAWGRDYSDVAPLKGVVFSGGAHELSVSVDVARV